MSTVTTNSLIRAESLQFTVGRRDLVSGIDFSISAGEVVGILGPNGAGKSTLLKLLCGQMAPTSGKVFFEERELAEWPPRELARRRAVLPQQSNVPFDFTSLEIVLLGRSPHGDAFSCEAMALEAMELTECAHLAGRIANTLSGGELQRVHLARVLVQIGLNGKDGVLMLDEPISNLDPAHQHAALRVARQMAGRGAAVLIILHDLNIAAQYCSRLVLMKDGHIERSGTPREIIESSLIERIFDVRVQIAENPTCDAPAVFIENS